ncbi:MAG: glycosyltransferase family 4 protein, partial [Synergistaceae bacterium]|nr:glycosyltransferase family 4 protein [Synergistaceae bacterium]
MRILYIVPGFDEGGVEVHVLNLIREMASRGHEVTLANSGGHLESELPESVRIIHLPVYRKNLFTVLYCSRKLAELNKKYRWDIIHAHSRVPAWVAWILSRRIKVKWLMTAHALYSLNPGLIALKHADGVICVSEAVRHHLQNYLPDENIIIPNGIVPPKLRNNNSRLRHEKIYTEEKIIPNEVNISKSEHKNIDAETITSEISFSQYQHEQIIPDLRPENKGITKFLTVGRLTRLKGIDVVLQALSELKNYDWSLDIIGEGPQHHELDELANNLGLSNRVKFHGAKDKHEIEIFMSEASCLLFPSHSEGMGLVVLEAVAEGLPVLASDLEALHEIAGENSGLIPDGDIKAWREAMRKFLSDGVACKFNPEKIITVHDM